MFTSNKNKKNLIRRIAKETNTLVTKIGVVKKFNMKNAGEVAVNMMDYVTDFEKNSISLLRHADKIFDTDSHCDLPPTLQRLFGQTNNRSKIVEFLNVKTPPMPK